MENVTFLFTAFLLVWLLTSGYIFILNRKQKKIADDIEILKKEIKQD